MVIIIAIAFCDILPESGKYEEKNFERGSLT